MGIWPKVFAFLTICAIAAAQTPPATSSLLKRAEDTAAKLPWLNAWDSLYDRDSTGPDSGRVLELMRELRAPWPAEQIRPLLKHSGSGTRNSSNCRNGISCFERQSMNGIANCGVVPPVLG